MNKIGRPRNGKHVSCKQCGTQIYRTQYRISLRENYFCDRKCSSLFASENINNEMRYNWKGNEVSYKTLHQWVRRNKPISKNCEECGEVKSLDAANISGKYLRDINDYKWLCRKCHVKYDGVSDILKKNAQKRSHPVILVDIKSGNHYKSESFADAARYLEVSYQAVTNAFNNKKMCKGHVVLNS